MLITDWRQAGAAGGCSGLDVMDVERGSSSCSHCGAQEGTSLVLAGAVMGRGQCPPVVPESFSSSSGSWDEQ